MNEAISLAPTDFEARLLLAQVYEAQGRHLDAAADLETALRLQNNASTRVWLAKIYLSLGNRDSAEEQVRGALALEPQNPDALGLEQEIQGHAPSRGSTP